MAELLFELFSEEIPARMQAAAAHSLLASLKDHLQRSNLEFDQAESFYGPRRLTFSIKGLPTRQPDQIIERKGPKEGAPAQAIAGFLRAAGLNSLDEAELRQTEKGKVWFAASKKNGLETQAVLPELLVKVIRGHRWPKSQRWAYTTFRWIRPLQRILAVFDGHVLDGSLDMGGGHLLPFTAQAEGHRFLGSGPFEVRSLSELESKLKQAFCLLRASDRKARIQQQLDALCTKYGLQLVEDMALLDEVAGLAEWPHVIKGEFDKTFLAVPQECLILSMRTHQKYFAARQTPQNSKTGGSLANAFFAVTNTNEEERLATIKIGK